MKIKLRKQLKDSLYWKYQKGYGQSKAGKVHNGTEAIHSHNTYKTYMREVNKFCDYCKAKEINTWQEAKQAVPDYLKGMEQDGKSAWTVTTALCGIAKAFDVRTTDFNYTAPQRHRSDIVRSRGVAVRDKNFSPEKVENRMLIRFCECTGLRRRELSAITGQSLAKDKTGALYVKIMNGKGGKVRYAKVIGSENDKKFVKGMILRAGQGKVFPKVHSSADIHRYRGTYAQNYYKEIARPLDTLSREEKYFCRGDMKGQTFDREALRVVSESLGHNRVDVVVNNYLYA